MPVTANSLQGFLAVFAQESLEQFVANMPKINMFTKNFDTSIANGGISVTTRIPTTVWGTPNDLSTNGWASSQASASAVTATLKERAYDIPFSELEFATITPQMLTNLYLPTMAKQLANGMVVDAINNVTSSYFTNTITPTSSSTFTLTGSTSLQAASTLLSNLEIPEEDRFAIVTPNIYQSLVAGALPIFNYGDAKLGMTGKASEVLNFQVVKYPRFYGASLPQGGAGYSGGDKLVGIVGNAQGLVMAVRAPLDINNGLVQSSTAVDATSGLSLQTRLVYDTSKPVWRLATVAIWGSAAGNKNAICPIITQSV